jgi:hypothetical protein
LRGVLHRRLRRDGAIVEVTVDKSSARVAVTRRHECGKLKNLQLETVARERLVKTGWEGVVGAAVFCKVWRLAVAL